MNKTVKKRYQELKSRNSNYVREKKWESNVLLQECLLTLGNNKKILALEQQKQILVRFNSVLPRLMDSNRKKSVQSVRELLPQWGNNPVYIIWDEESLPIIKTDFESILVCIDDVIAVAFETWITTMEMNQFIQFSSRNKMIEITFEGSS